ncbi:MAG: carbon monoxide dehydrogenase [Acidimicrobiaceae bacterium]|nr:carbon monoxide dehydrogenase [Acidimicrobiaceae bacterium]
MIPASFDYERATSVEHALSQLKEHGEEAKLLAGGHSLLPLMKYRLAAPAVVVDIGRLSEMSYVREDGDVLAIGALTRHRDVEVNELVRSQAGLLSAATSKVGDPQVRHRGTLGGSLSHGDPASDLPAAIIALGGSLVIEGLAGRREVFADDFFTGFLETDLAADEMLVEVRVPKAPGARWSFQKFNRRAQDWAIVGAAVQVDGDRCGVGLVNMDSRPVRATGVEAAVVSGGSAADAAAVAADGLEPPADLNAGVEYRCHLARVLTRRGLEESGIA